MEYNNIAKGIPLAFVVLLVCGCQHKKLTCINGFVFNDGGVIGRCHGAQDIPYKPDGSPDFEFEYMNELEERTNGR